MQLTITAMCVTTIDITVRLIEHQIRDSVGYLGRGERRDKRRGGDVAGEGRERKNKPKVRMRKVESKLMRKRV